MKLQGQVHWKMHWKFDYLKDVTLIPKNKCFYYVVLKLIKALELSLYELFIVFKML